jgi:hypothetical protein
MRGFFAALRMTTRKKEVRDDNQKKEVRDDNQKKLG